MKIYNLPSFTTVLEFLTMHALNTGRLLRARPPFLPSSLPPLTLKTQNLPQGGTPDILSAARQVLIDWNHHKIPFYSDPPTLHASHVPSTLHLKNGTEQVAPGAEMTGYAQIVDELGTPFVLDGLFGDDADADADAEMMDVEDEVDGGMQIDDEPYVRHTSSFFFFQNKTERSALLCPCALCRSNPRKRAHSPPANASAPAPNKRPRRLSQRTVPLPSASSAIHSRRARRKQHKLKLMRERTGGVTNMEV